MAKSVSKRGILAAKPEIYGYSAEEIPLHVWLPQASRAELLIFAGIHGEEPDTTMLLSRALRSASRSHPCCAIILCANPDGMRYGTRGNANGVDLNRNFPASNWQPDPVTHRWNVDSDSTVVLSPGTEPSSEPETEALVQIVRALQPDCVVSLHSPLGLIDDPESTALGELLAARTGLPREVIPNHLTPGSFGSWAGDIGVPSITYELPNSTIWEMHERHLPVLCDLIEHGLSGALALA